DRKPVFDPAGRCWCYYLADGIWVAGGGINNGGIVYSWMKDIAGESDCWEIDLHRPRPLFLPFLVGERSPNWDAYARGVLFGLSYFHDRDALMQSTFEAVAFRIRSIEEMLQRVVGEPHRVVVSGGFAISEKGSRVLCDTLGVPVFLSSLPSAPTKGAFLLSRKVLGEVTTLDQLSPDYFPDNPLLEPIPERVQFYTELYRFYLKLYQANAPLS
ncbi:MAG: FGGY-family carbohydrate kinase, partial [Candidatus Atribacteria bacterium]|nr:FGGY-family carbohydrate kinase [Candidatus Atribacteria bacterium]